MFCDENIIVRVIVFHHLEQDVVRLVIHGETR